MVEPVSAAAGGLPAGGAGGIGRAILSAADNGRMTRSAARAAAVVEAAQPAPATTTIRVPARAPSTATGAIAVVR